MTKIAISILFEYPETINNTNVLLEVIELIWMMFCCFVLKNVFYYYFNETDIISKVVKDKDYFLQASLTIYCTTVSFIINV